MTLASSRLTRMRATILLGAAQIAALFKIDPETHQGVQIKNQSHRETYNRWDDVGEMNGAAVVIDIPTGNSAI